MPEVARVKHHSKGRLGAKPSNVILVYMLEVNSSLYCQTISDEMKKLLNINTRPAEKFPNISSKRSKTFKRENPRTTN